MDSLAIVAASTLLNFLCTSGLVQKEWKDAKETATYKWVLIVAGLFNIAVDDFDAKKSACYSRVLL